VRFNIGSKEGTSGIRIRIEKERTGLTRANSKGFRTYTYLKTYNVRTPEP
jgi:hypothetical protein